MKILRMYVNKMFHEQANQVSKQKNTRVCMMFGMSTPVVLKERETSNVAIFFKGSFIAISESSRHYDDLCEIYPILLVICMSHRTLNETYSYTLTYRETFFPDYFLYFHANIT